MRHDAAWGAPLDRACASWLDEEGANAVAAELWRACSHTSERCVCAQIHTCRGTDGMCAVVRSGVRFLSVRSPHEASSSGQPSVDRLRDHLLTCARCWPLAKRRLVRTSS